MSAQERMIRTYDRALGSKDYRNYFDDSGFYNFGYWENRAKSQREASEALIDELVAAIAIKGGRVLDVACGPGATTQRLMRYYEPQNITAINISAAQVDAARERAKGCTVLVMDATRLDFPDESFDAVMCVEAAFHFNTRETFLKEVLRVLKPGGSLVMTDMLFRKFLKPFGDFGQVPPANFIQDIDTYRSRFKAAGFDNVNVRDVTDACLGGFRRHLSQWPMAERRNGRMSLGKSAVASFASAMIARYFHTVCKSYLIAYGRKPANT